MKNKRSKNSKPMTALERGQEFLDGFKKLPYSTDRIGQSFIMKAGPALIQAHKTDLPEEDNTSESPSEGDKVEKYRVTLKPKQSEPRPSEPATEVSETAEEDLRLFLDYIKILRAFERRDKN
jgi:hypothetical protein